MENKKLPWANKDLGQHFLIDQLVIDSICDDFKDEASAIIEVGPGPGILTEHLAKHDLPFFVIEKDERFPEYLEQFIKSDQITLTDALEVNLEEFFVDKDINNDKLWLVSNLPYNVGVPLMINFIKAKNIRYMTLMFQKEVANKVVSFVGKKQKAMGSLLALSQNYFKVEVLCKVAPEAFRPPPKVDSTVVSMTRIDDPVIPLEEFHKYEKFLRKLFALKRKQVGKVLKPHYPVERIESALEKVGLDRTKRAESFTLEQVQLLYKDLEF